jgi:hypothetical protein
MKTEIEDIITKGLVPDIFKAESAIYAHKCIGQYANEINSSQMHIKSFFANIQNMTLTESVLALSRVFDKPNNRFPNRCILGLINKLSTSAEDAPKIIETYQTIEQLKIHGMP